MLQICYISGVAVCLTPLNNNIRAASPKLATDPLRATKCIMRLPIRLQHRKLKTRLEGYRVQLIRECRVMEAAILRHKEAESSEKRACMAHLHTIYELGKER